MKVLLHMPRRSEAAVVPLVEEDITISPKFYKRTGWVTVMNLTTVDANGNEERYALSLSAATKALRMERLVEVVPECDDPTGKKVTDAESGE